MFLIDIRLSRPEAWLQDRFAMESAAGAIEDQASAHAFSWAFFRDARLLMGATMCQFYSQRKGKTRLRDINPSRTAASLNLVVLSFVKDWFGRNTQDALLRQPNQLPTSAVPDLPSIW
jgi:hypothetical protein